MNIAGYDAWRLQGPEECDDIGTEDGDQCNRITEPDEDAPRGYKPNPCTGVMMDGFCDTCHAIAD